MDTAARLLALLTLLQTQSTWTSEELADRLAVTPRTVRRDVHRLRELGYSVDADPGLHGGYRLARGKAMPPLVLTDDEALAVAVGLRTATAGGVAGLDEAAVTALVKLEQVLPSRVRERVAALGDSTVGLTSPAPAMVDADVLVVLAEACRRGERIRYAYRDSRGRVTRRDADPYRLVHAARRWYLVARDLRRGDWRTFRVDRITQPQPLGVRSRLPERPDAAALVARALAFGPYQREATVRLHVPLGDAQRRVPSTVGTLEADGDATLFRLGADDFEWLARYLVGLGCDFTVVEPEELETALRRLGEDLVARHR